MERVARRMVRVGGALGCVLASACPSDGGSSDDASTESAGTSAPTTTDSTTTASSMTSTTVPTTTVATEVDETSATSGGYGSTDYGPTEPPPIELVPCELAAGADAPGPPRLISAEFIEGALVLQFSEPIVPPDDVDPTRFRLSIATYYEGYGSYSARSYYADPNWFLCGHTDACLDEYVSVAEIGCLAEDPSVVALRVEDFTYLVCESVNFAMMYQDIHMLLHYAQGTPPLIEDPGGEALASFGAPWVDGPDQAMQVDGRFPNADPLIEIPCPSPFD